MVGVRGKCRVVKRPRGYADRSVRVVANRDDCEGSGAGVCGSPGMHPRRHI